jgi:hypothetical protein
MMFVCLVWLGLVVRLVVTSCHPSGNVLSGVVVVSVLGLVVVVGCERGSCWVDGVGLVGGGCEECWGLMVVFVVGVGLSGKFCTWVAIAFVI